MVDNKINFKYLGGALLISIMIVSVIFVAGKELTKIRADGLESDISQLKIQQDSNFLTYRLSQDRSNTSCSAYSILEESSAEDLYETRQKLATHRNAGKIESPRYESLKKQYNLLLIQDYVTRTQEKFKSCKNQSTALYFYRKDCDKCEAQSAILSEHRRERNNTFVYPIDAELELTAVEFLKSDFNVSTYPTIIYNGEKIEGLTAISELNALNAQQSNG